MQNEWVFRALELCIRPDIDITPDREIAPRPAVELLLPTRFQPGEHVLDFFTRRRGSANAEAGENVPMLDADAVPVDNRSAAGTDVSPPS